MKDKISIVSKVRSRNIISDLKDLLSKGQASTQDEIGHALAKLGYESNQSKVSRLLRKIGAVKSKNEHGQIVYRLPKEPAPPTFDMEVGNLIIDIKSNENIVLIHTSPGSASVISRALDYHLEKCGILGTVAGDDTILVIPKSVKETQKTLQKIKELIYNWVS